jgi:hypothetical protein
MGTEESKKPNGKVRQVSHGKDVKVREMRTAETILNIIQDRGTRQSIPLCRRCHMDVHFNRPKSRKQGN